MTDNVIFETESQEGLGRTIFKNTAFITLGDIALKALGFLFSVYVIRQLGDDRFGQYSIVLKFVGLFQVFLELGMTQYVLRETSKYREKTQSLLWNLIAIRLVLAVLGIAVITLLGIAFGYSTEILLGIFIYTLSFVLSAFQIPLITVLKANERFDYVTLLQLGSRLIFFTLGGILLFMGQGYISLIVANIVHLPLQIGLSIWLIRRIGMSPIKPIIHPHTWPQLIRSGLPFGIISLFLTIAFSIDTVMLSWFESERVVGWYNVAYGLIPSVMFFFGGFKNAIVPSLSRTFVNDPQQVSRWYQGSVRFILLASLPIAVGGTVIAFPLIRFLYTDEFLPSGLALQILIWDVPFLMFTSFAGKMATITGEERSAARIFGINTAANVVLNLYAIPKLGLIGAAFVTVITDLVGAIQFHALFRRKLELPNMTSVLIRITLVSMLMGGVVLQVGHIHLFLQVAIGVVIYIPLLFISRLMGQAELKLIRDALVKVTKLIPTKDLTDDSSPT